MVGCPAEVRAACEGGTCVACPVCTVNEDEGAGNSDADAEGDEVGEDEVGEVKKGGDADEGQGGGREGLVGEEGMYSSEIVDEGMYERLCRERGRCRSDGVGPVTKAEDEEDGDGEKEPGKKVSGEERKKRGALEGEIRKETEGPPESEDEDGLFPRGGPGENVGQATDAVNVRSERNEVQRQRRGSGRYKVDERHDEREMRLDRSVLVQVQDGHLMASNGAINPL